jgi:hypothetical protein
MNDKPEPKKSLPAGGWIGVGIAIGVALGAAIDNIGAGIAIGLAVGAAIALQQTRRGK